MECCCWLTWADQYMSALLWSHTFRDEMKLGYWHIILLYLSVTSILFQSHVIFYLWKQSKAPVNSLLLLPALSSCVACVLWTKIQGRCCLLHIVITTQRDVYQSRNMQHTHNIRRERRNKNNKSGESSEIACMPLRPSHGLWVACRTLPSKIEI